MTPRSAGTVTQATAVSTPPTVCVSYWRPSRSTGTTPERTGGVRSRRLPSSMPSASRGVVVVVGAIHADLVVGVDRLPGPGETAVGAGLERHGGGKGANAAVAAARAGAPVC